MSRYTVNNFALEKVMSAAKNSRLLTLDIELSGTQSEALSGEEITSVIRQAAALGMEQCTFCCGEQSRWDLLEEVLIFLSELKIPAAVEFPGRMITRERMELLKKYQTQINLFYSEKSDFSPELAAMLPERNVRVLMLPLHGKTAEFITLWHEFSQLGLQPAASCTSSSGALPETEFLPDEAEQKHLESECGILLPGCLQLLCACFISATGLVYPCRAMKTLLGDIRQSSLEEIYFRSKVLSLHREHPKRVKEPCLSCEKLSQCTGCAARAYEKTGDYMAGDPFCSRNFCKQEAIKALPMISAGMLPHAESMLLIDRIVYLTELCSIHEAVVRSDNPFLGKNGVMEVNAFPEYAAQAAALRDSVEKGGKPSPGLLCEVSKTRFFKSAKVGDILSITVSTEYNMDMWYGIKFQIKVNGENAAEGNLKLCIYDEQPLPY